MKAFPWRPEATNAVAVSNNRKDVRSGVHLCASTFLSMPQAEDYCLVDNMNFDLDF